MAVQLYSMWMLLSRHTRCKTSNTLSPSEKATLVEARITPSDGTIPCLDSSHRPILFRIVRQEMENVQVWFLLVSMVVSSGSTGVGFPGGTGSVWYLSLPVAGSITCLCSSSVSSCFGSSCFGSSFFSSAVSSCFTSSFLASSFLASSALDAVSFLLSLVFASVCLSSVFAVSPFFWPSVCS